MNMQFFKKNFLSQQKLDSNAYLNNQSNVNIKFDNNSNFTMGSCRNRCTLRHVSVDGTMHVIHTYMRFIYQHIVTICSAL